MGLGYLPTDQQLDSIYTVHRTNHPEYQVPAYWMTWWSKTTIVLLIHIHLIPPLPPTKSPLPPRVLQRLFHLCFLFSPRAAVFIIILIDVFIGLRNALMTLLMILLLVTSWGVTLGASGIPIAVSSQCKLVLCRRFNPCSMASCLLTKDEIHLLGPYSRLVTQVRAR